MYTLETALVTNQRQASSGLHPRVLGMGEGLHRHGAGEAGPRWGSRTRPTTCLALYPVGRTDGHSNSHPFLCSS